MTNSKDIELQQMEAGAIGLGSYGAPQNKPKPLDPNDPMEIKADSVAGDERLMMECLIEEFAHLGWSAKKIARMFDEPFFLAAHGLEKRFGRQAVLECIEHTLARCGVFHFEMEEPSAGNRESSMEQESTGELQVIRIMES
jgi:hypothetical protein